MKKSYLVILLMVLFTVSLFAQKALVLVKDLDDIKYQLPIIDYIDNNYLLLVEEKDLEVLKNRDFKPEILDNNVQGKEYYLVHLYNQSPDNVIPYSKKILNKYGTVLADFGFWILMETNDQRMNLMTEYDYQLDYVELEIRDLHINNTVWSDPEKLKTQYNPLIEELLGRVNPDSVEAFQRKLCDFTTRHVRSTFNKGEVVPYLKETYMKYGCDTVLELSLSSSVEVVGIRRGTVDPSYKKFVLLGGHSDTKISGGAANDPHQGANDNATGQVAVLEACRVHQYYDFDYTIMYAMHNGEEVGFWGSNALSKHLKNEGCQVINGGGVFSYDMFGMRKSNMKFRVYQLNPGANEFVDKMKDMKQTYELTQPTEINLTSSSSISSDPSCYWRQGFACIGHNFAMAGAGSIHTVNDVITGSYDKVFQAEVAKLGIITTADIAGIKAVTDIQKKLTSQQNGILRYQKSGNAVIFLFNNNRAVPKGRIEIYNVKGTHVKTLNVNPDVNNVAWNGTNMTGQKIAQNSVLVARYVGGTTIATVKCILP